MYPNLKIARRDAVVAVWTAKGLFKTVTSAHAPNQKVVRAGEIF